MKSPLPVLLLPLIVSLALGGCASNHSDANAPFLSGQTGSVNNVDGIDIWQDRKPDRPYKVIRTVEDRRQNNLTPSNTIFQALALQARAADGNGIIIVSMNNDVTGGQVFNPTPYAPGSPSNVTNGHSTVTTAQVIIYTDQKGVPFNRLSQPEDVPPPTQGMPSPPNSPL